MGARHEVRDLGRSTDSAEIRNVRHAGYRLIFHALHPIGPVVVVVQILCPIEIVGHVVDIVAVVEIVLSSAFHIIDRVLGRIHYRLRRGYVRPAPCQHGLDADHRIQAFDSEGNYITQWGSEGADEGQFDFLDGLRPQEFSGSIVVDDEGFIYVADAGNKRIQKFAP